MGELISPSPGRQDPDPAPSPATASHQTASAIVPPDEEPEIIIHRPAGPRAAVKPILLRVPMASVAVAMVAGIVLGRYLVLPPGVWAALAGAGLLTALATLPKRHLHLASAAGLGLSIAAGSALYLHYMYFTLDRDHVVLYAADTPVLATLRGRVATMPQVQAQSGPAYRPAARTSFLLQASQIRLNGQATPAQTAATSAATAPAAAPADRWATVSGLVRVAVQEVEDRLQPGMDVEIMGWLGRLEGPDNPGQSDWARIGREGGILVRLTVESPDAVEIRNSYRSWPARAYWHVRSSLREHLWTSGGRQGPLLGALIVGERQPALRELNRMMVRAGTAHFLSISGMHLAIFVGFIYALCRLGTMTPRSSAAVVLVVLATYVALAEPNAPLLRAAIMAACVCLGAIVRRPYASLNALAASAVLLLAFEPMQLFSAGFQLSFAIVCGLILLHRPIRRLLFGRWLRRRGLTVFREGDWFRRWMYYRAAEGGITAITISVAASVASMPLVAVHFGLFSPYAPLLSILLSPLITAVLVPGYLAVGLAGLTPNLAYSLGQLSAQACGWLDGAVRLCDYLPGLSFNVYPVGAIWAGLWFLGVALLVWAWRWTPGKVAFATICAAFLAATIYTQRPAPPPDGLELHLLDVGAGQCALLRTPTGRSVLIDAGSQAGLVGEEVLPPFLRTERLARPDCAFVSHANVDHFNALMSPQGWLDLRSLWVNPWLGKDQDEPPEAGQFLKAIHQIDCQTHRLSAGQTVKLDERTTVEVLWPPPEQRESLSINETSLVLRVTADGRSILLPGDLETTGQIALSKLGQKIRSDVLVLPHHGGWRRTLPEFVKAVGPKVVLVSCSRDPQGSGKADDPSRAFFRSLKTSGNYYSTAVNGWIRVRLRGERVDVTTMKGEAESR